MTVNVTEFDAPTPVVTITAPVDAPLGTMHTILVALQLVTLTTSVLLNVMVEPPCVAPKFVPVMVTDAPTSPAFGLKVSIEGYVAAVTVNTTLLDVPVEVVTVTAPVVAPLGTAQVNDVALQIEQIAALPL